MLINSLHYLCFFPITVLLFYMIPQKFKPAFMLTASYIFYACFSPKGLVILWYVTALTYICAIAMQRVRYRKLILVLHIVLCIGLLVLFKYYGLGVNIAEYLLGKLGITVRFSEFSLLTPIGISFFTFQAVGYIIDVYKELLRPERNFIKLALFVGFFPTISSGPIMRAGDFFAYIQRNVSFNYEKCRRGLMQIAYGIFLKMVIADRLAILVNNVFADYKSYRGFELAIGAVAFSLEIYCDFAGYSNMAIGSAKVLGFDLKDNFDCPYFSKSISEFWRRWHISLSSWFRDYLYIPLGGNRKGKVKKYVNLMIVFLVSGLWHGNSLSFLFWGGINGAYQVVGEVLKPYKRKVANILRIDEERCSIKALKVVGTFLLTTIAWIFFRANTFGDACGFIERMFASFNPAIFWDETIFALGLDRKEFNVVLVAMVVLLVADLCRYKSYDLLGAILRQPIVVRWMIYYILVFSIIIYGIYGGTYNAQNFIYFKF